MISIPKSGGLVLKMLFILNNTQIPDTQTLIAYDPVKRCFSSLNQTNEFLLRGILDITILQTNNQFPTIHDPIHD